MTHWAAKEIKPDYDPIIATGNSCIISDYTEAVLEHWQMEPAMEFFKEGEQYGTWTALMKMSEQSFNSKIVSLRDIGQNRSWWYS